MKTRLVAFGRSGLEREAWFTTYSLFHFLAGFLWGRYVKTGLFDWLLVHTVFEVIENASIGINAFKAAGFPEYRGDCPENSVGDTLSAALGYVLATGTG